MNQFEEFISNIIEYIVEHYNIPEYKAKQIVEEITEHSLFHDHPDMVMHDGIECWAYIIFKTYNKTMSRKLVEQFLHDTERTDSRICYDIQEFRDYFEHFGEDNLKLLISRLIRDNFLGEDDLKAGYSFEDALDFIDWFYKILEDVDFNTHDTNKIKISTPQQVKDINKKNNTNTNSKKEIKVHNNGDIVEKINNIYNKKYFDK